MTSNETSEIILTWRYGDVQIFYGETDGDVYNDTVGEDSLTTYVIPDVNLGTTYNIELRSGSSSYIITVQTYEGRTLNVKVLLIIILIFNNCGWH